MLHAISASRHINVIGHYDDETLIDRDGKLIKLFSLDSVHAVTRLQSALSALKHQRNSLFQALQVPMVMYTWIVRSRVSDSAVVDEADGSRYKTSVEPSDLFQHRLYIALVTEAPASHFNNLADLSRHSTKKPCYLDETAEALRQIAHHFCNAVADGGIEPLRVIRQEDQGGLSEALKFIGRLINLEDMAFPLLTVDTSHYLPHKRLFFNDRSGVIEASSAEGHKKFAVMLSLKQYSDCTFPDMLAVINNFPIELVLTQSYRFSDTARAETANRYLSKGFERQGVALEESANKASCWRLHHLTLCCLSDRPRQLHRVVSDMMAAFRKTAILCVREDIGSEAAFWAQLPGNFTYVIREAVVATQNQNFSSLPTSFQVVPYEAAAES